MNAIWRAKREAAEAGRQNPAKPVRVPRAPKPPKPRKVKAKLRETVQDFPCGHRGAILGKLDCHCKGKPEVFACDLHTRCMIHAAAHPGPLKFYPATGPTEEIARQDRPHVCSTCSDRPHAPESPVIVQDAIEPETGWKPRPASAASTAAREAICGACPVRGQCGLPSRFLGYALTRCPDGRWGADG